MEDAILELFRKEYNEERKGGSGCHFIGKEGNPRPDAEKWIEREMPGHKFNTVYELQIDFDEPYDVATHAQHYAEFPCHEPDCEMSKCPHDREWCQHYCACKCTCRKG